jgi:hypothetical protein
MSAKFCIVTPHQGPPFNDVALISFRRSAEVLAGHRWIFAVPHGTDMAPFREIAPHAEARFFPAEYFSSKRSAQWFYMHPDLFDSFADFDYLLIHQLDVYVFEDRLAEWVARAEANDWDYIGAPWFGHQWLRFARHPLARLPWHWFLRESVGSGGFSLRKVSTCRAASRKDAGLIRRFLRHFVPEDIYWCQLAQWLGTRFRRPSPEIAASFAFETECERCFAMNDGSLPFAVHGWNRHDWEFWRNRIPGAAEVYERLAASGVSPL